MGPRMAAMDPLVPDFILFDFLLALPFPELDKLKKLSHEIRNPGKQSSGTSWGVWSRVESAKAKN